MSIDNMYELEALGELLEQKGLLTKQALSIRHSSKPTVTGERKVGFQGIIEIIWEGRNHVLHWEEVPLKKKSVKDMFDALSRDLHVTIVPGKNNSLSILGALGWKSTEKISSDLKELVH